MGSKGQEGPGIYRLRAVLRSISPLIWSRLLVGSDSSIAQLHEACLTSDPRRGRHLSQVVKINGQDAVRH